MSQDASLTNSISDQLGSRLAKRGFNTTLTHFRHAGSALSRGEWEGANAQTRSFLDSLCEDIVRQLWSDQSDGAPTGGQARAYLQEAGFLNSNEGELLRALFKILHEAGSHPGISGEDDANRRIVMASSLANHYLDLLEQREEEERRREEAETQDLMRLERFAESILGPSGFMSIGTYSS